MLEDTVGDMLIDLGIPNITMLSCVHRNTEQVKAFVNRACRSNYKYRDDFLSLTNDSTDRTPIRLLRKVLQAVGLDLVNYANPEHTRSEERVRLRSSYRVVGDNLDELKALILVSAFSSNEQKITQWFKNALSQNGSKIMNKGVYKIVCEPTGQIYYGSSGKLTDRFFSHRYLLRKLAHFNTRLQTLWHIYGEDNFSFIVIQRTTDYRRQEKALIGESMGSGHLLNTSCKGTTKLVIPPDVMEKLTRLSNRLEVNFRELAIQLLDRAATEFKCDLDKIDKSDK